MARRKKDDDYLVVVAIDFGTTFSGIALSLRPTSEEPDQHIKSIYMKTDWKTSTVREIND